MEFRIVASIIICVPFAAHAYPGPGAGLGAIAAALAILAGLFLLAAAFPWYPPKRSLRGNMAAAENSALPQTED